MSEENTQTSTDISTEDSTKKDTVLPLEVIDRAIGTDIKILLTNNKEFTGKLVGFDDFVNVVLEEATEIDGDGNQGKKIKRMLLNGSQIAMLSPSL
ncbi:hypothetical protein FT663_00019 [Candidozyma haemuli var. vulneris]|nr:hypothetical protein FT662_00185 [[Candida] haemuloni var. vulneris]KAF3995796.1 hypothetical protein FT663_00019 [[Candida] haemuloni var. vulneris]